MFVITATELKKLIGHTISMADKQPVLITKTNKPRVVMLSVHEYNRLLKNQKDYVEETTEIIEVEEKVEYDVPKPIEYVENTINEEALKNMSLDEILKLHGTAWND